MEYFNMDNPIDKEFIDGYKQHLKCCRMVCGVPWRGQHH